MHLFPVTVTGYSLPGFAGPTVYLRLPRTAGPGEARARGRKGGPAWENETVAENFLPSLFLRGLAAPVLSCSVYNPFPVKKRNKMCLETHFTAVMVSVPHLLTWTAGGNLLSPTSQVSMLQGNK